MSAVAAVLREVRFRMVPRVGAGMEGRAATICTYEPESSRHRGVVSKLQARAWLRVAAIHHGPVQCPVATMTMESMDRDPNPLVWFS